MDDRVLEEEPADAVPPAQPMEVEDAGDTADALNLDEPLQIDPDPAETHVVTEPAAMLPDDDAPAGVTDAADPLDVERFALAGEEPAGDPVPATAEAPAEKVPALGALLMSSGLLTRDQLQKALEEQRRSGRKLGRILIDLGFLRESDIVRALAKQVGLDFVDLTEYTVDPAAAALVPEQTARRYLAMGIGFENGKLILAMSDPSNVFALDDIRTMAGMDVKPVVAAASDVEAAIRRYSRMDQAVEDVASQAAQEALDQEELEKAIGAGAAVEDAPIVKLVNLLITQAVSDRASDIHVEPTERDVRIRYRIDGVLHEVMRSPKNIQQGLVSRLKIMSDINIAERRLPQDGRVSLSVRGKGIDLRVATLPTVYGEKVVMRILDKSSALLRLEDLGFLPGAYERYEESFRKPYGAILATGPTGSGKSTTLYATLNVINLPDRNIITVEDPVEYRLAGVNQIQIHSKAGLTFASALRSILRADPDVVLIGEIRDRETALIATEASMTGHLVLSTLHTNDAASAITRLIEMGVESYLVASALDCVVAQRLARRLCDRCREAYEPDEYELEEAGYPEAMWDDVPELYRAVGCSVCSKTGFLGRLGLYEVMPITEEIERLTVSQSSSEDIRRLAVEQGMLTLRDDGLEKVRMGQTTIEEVLRVVA